MLEIKNLVVNYGAISALHAISLSVPAGKIVTLIGANGAGKTTTLKTISGLLKPASGEILYEGKNIAGLPPHQIVARGISQSPEGRMIFANLTVLENLQLGAYLQKNKEVVRRELENIFVLFPRLKEREKQIAGTLSGGEQQMLAIGRALMSRPHLLLLDEPSLGLAPLLVKTIFEKIVEINRNQGLTILLVEQNANLALEIFPYRLRPRNRQSSPAGRLLRITSKSQSKKRLFGRLENFRASKVVAAVVRYRDSADAGQPSRARKFPCSRAHRQKPRSLFLRGGSERWDNYSDSCNSFLNPHSTIPRTSGSFAMLAFDNYSPLRCLT